MMPVTMPPPIFLIPPHDPSAPTRVGAPVENAENAQEEENSPLLITDRNVAFVIVYNHKMMYLDPKDSDTDNDYISDDRNDHDFDLDMHEPGRLTRLGILFGVSILRTELVHVQET
jgi:hypothetical protein